MPDISLTDFVDFAIKAGPAQLTKVRELARRGDYDPRCDFWKPLRECIQDSHAKKRKLEDALLGLKDPKKLKRYPLAVRAYKKFVGKKAIGWFEPPFAIWTYDGLNVRVNPELGLNINGKKFAVKLYFKDDKPTEARLRVVFEMMRLTLNLDPDVTPAVLDVAKSHLLPAKSPDDGLAAALEAQAKAFVHMWNAMHAKSVVQAAVA